MRASRTLSLSVVILAILASACATQRDAIESARRAEEGLEKVEISATPIAEIHFAAGTTTLSAASRSSLAQLADQLRSEGSGLYLEVQGHADASGSRAANQRLAEGRAEAVRRYLNVSGGIPLPRISVVVLGASVPAAGNETPEGRALNRRVVVVAVRSEEPPFDGD